MTEDPKPRRNAPRKSRLAATETVNFADYPEVQEFVKVRAKANCRSISEEIVFRLKAAMKQAKGGFQEKESRQ